MLFLSCSLASTLPQLFHIEHTKRRRGKSKQNQVGREKSISPKAIQKERWSGGIWNLLTHCIMSTYIHHSISVQFKLALACTSGQNPLGNVFCPAYKIRKAAKGRETPFLKHPHPVKPLWLLLSPYLSLFLLHTIPTMANSEGKIINTGLQLHKSKIRFCALRLKLLNQLSLMEIMYLHFFPIQRITAIWVGIWKTVLH